MSRTEKVLHVLSVCVCVCVCVCVVCVALEIQHAKRVLHIILPSVACPALPNYSTLPHKEYDFRRKKKLFDIKCALLFALQLVSETYFTLRRIQRNIVINLRKYS